MDEDEVRETLEMLDSVEKQRKAAKEKEEVKSRTRAQSRDDSVEMIWRNAKFIMKHHPD